MSVVRVANLDQWTVVDYVETRTTQLDLTACPKRKQTKKKEENNKQRNEMKEERAYKL